LAGDNTANQNILQIVAQAFNDDLTVSVSAILGKVGVTWEDNNQGLVSIANVVQLDTYVGDWVQIHIKWDTTRCDDGGGTEPCDTDASEEELGVRYRVDDNQDGDFGDGGAEDWSAWTYEASALNMKPWDPEPTTDDMLYGMQGTHVVDIRMDDIEISDTQPSW
jgi:hypothetical protein